MVVAFLRGSIPNLELMFSRSWVKIVFAPIYGRASSGEFCQAGENSRFGVQGDYAGGIIIGGPYTWVAHNGLQRRW
jgi:hypothetical protein